MANKTYTSKSDISISVVVENTGVHLSFIPVTGSGSVYMTEDEKLQNAIENHYNFGKLFQLRAEPAVEEKTEKKGKGQKNKADEGGGQDNDNTGGEGDEGAGKNVVTVTCPDDAKDYLADKFGVSRTSMKTVASIKKIAASNNIEFNGI